MKSPIKLDFDEAIEHVGEGQSLRRDQVRASALRRKVWVASNGSPGCLNDHASVCTTKADAVASALQVADSGEGAPRGMATALREHGRFVDSGIYIYRVERMRLADLF